jgi:voltage-gated potassium channel
MKSYTMPEITPPESLRKRTYEVIFGTSTPAGKRFDVVLLWLIGLSVLAVILESVPTIQQSHSWLFTNAELLFTGLFTVEYLARIWSHPQPLRYIFSVWGIIDLLSILPSYLRYFLVGGQYLVSIRILRLLRIFRILKLGRFFLESQSLARALRASVYKISIFMMVLLFVVIILGSVMYVVEGTENGFTSIPQGIYWAIITITTVGYGDVVPVTGLGKLIASLIMLMGYSVIAVPTGILTVEIGKASRGDQETTCPDCQRAIEVQDALFCPYCGEDLSKHKHP